LAKRLDLAIESRRDGAVGLLRLRGEVQAEQVHRLHEAAADLRADGAKHLMLDLGGVTFVDSASVGEMVRLDAEAAEAGGRTVFFAVPRIVRRVLDVTGLGTRVRTADDEAGARAALSRSAPGSSRGPG
jgi:anti-sigma B factor antagonist